MTMLSRTAGRQWQQHRRHCNCENKLKNHYTTIGGFKAKQNIVRLQQHAEYQKRVCPVGTICHGSSKNKFKKKYLSFRWYMSLPARGLWSGKIENLSTTRKNTINVSVASCRAFFYVTMACVAVFSFTLWKRVLFRCNNAHNQHYIRNLVFNIQNAHPKGEISNAVNTDATI